MKLTTVLHEDRRKIVAVMDDGLIDLHADVSGGGELPRTLRGLLAGGEEALQETRRRIRASTSRIPFAESHLLAPIADPQKFLGLGFSYRSHVEELLARRKDLRIGAHQVWFNKQVSCIAGPYDDIHKPALSEQLDYEGEMALVIGRRCRHVRAAEAMPVIAGYMVCNDVSVRDWQLRASTVTLGKSFDTHGPTGPWITFADEVPDPGALRLQTWVNGELRQNGSTADFIYSIGQMIEELSAVCTLEPGDILATGTPGGVGMGFIPPRYLKAGDRVRIEIDHLGAIENRVIDEP